MCGALLSARLSQHLEWNPITTNIIRPWKVGVNGGMVGLTRSLKKEWLNFQFVQGASSKIVVVIKRWSYYRSFGEVPPHFKYKFNFRNLSSYFPAFSFKYYSLSWLKLFREKISNFFIYPLSGKLEQEASVNHLHDVITCRAWQFSPQTKRKLYVA